MDTNKKLYTLQIDPEFVRLIYPLNKKELKDMEYAIKYSDNYGSIRVWNSCVVIDFDKYLLCHKYRKPFTIEKMPLKDRTEVIAYICEEECKRQDIPKEMYKYLIGKRYICEKLLGSHLASSVKRSDKKKGQQIIENSKFDSSGVQTRERLSKEYHMSSPTVFKYGLFSQKIDELYCVAPTLAEMMVFGTAKIGHEQLLDLMKLPTDKLAEMELNIARNNNKNKSYTEVREMIQGYVQMSHTTKKGNTTDDELNFTIKEMPEYDPDLEFSSLALTIHHSWINSINRTREKGVNKGISIEKRNQLENELCSLKTAIDSLLDAIRRMN